MKTILIIIRKEFLQIFRNPVMVPVIFIVPVVQLIILVNAATLEMKSIDIFIMDKDQSPFSSKLVSSFVYSPFFNLAGYSNENNIAKEAMDKDKADLILNIPANFERDLVREDRADVQLQINAINGVSAGIINAYANEIIAGVNHNIRMQWMGLAEDKPLINNVSINYSYWYNPDLNYKVFMVPAVLTILVTIIGMFLSGLNLVREKETGTIEQINVTPVKKYQFIAGKLIPFWILALAELSVGLTIGKFLFDIPIVGSLFLVFGITGIYLLVVLGLGLFISTMVETQQQTMFVGYFFVLIFILMSGLFTPVESMPEWGQKLNLLNPLAYLLKSLRMILLKGSGFTDLIHEFTGLSVYAVIALALATWRYKKVV